MTQERILTARHWHGTPSEDTGEQDGRENAQKFTVCPDKAVWLAFVHFCYIIWHNFVHSAKVAAICLYEVTGERSSDSTKVKSNKVDFTVFMFLLKVKVCTGNFSKTCSVLTWPRWWLCNCSCLSCIPISDVIKISDIGVIVHSMGTFCWMLWWILIKRSWTVRLDCQLAYFSANCMQILKVSCRISRLHWLHLQLWK